MEELNDKDFDQLFRNRITKDFPEFEEDSWSKMEKKLDRRDRFVFYRNASIILLFLSFGLGLYFIPKKEITKTEVNAINKKEKIDENIAPVNKQPKENRNHVQPEQLAVIDSKVKKFTPTFFNRKETKIAQKELIPESIPTEKNTAQIDPSPIIQKPAIEQAIAQVSQPVEVQTKETATNTIIPTERIAQEVKKITKTKRAIPISVAFSVGPDFNSTSSIIGGKSGLALGIGVSVGLSKRLSLQTGINYGTKNYNASNYDYTFKNPSIIPSIDEVNAVCKVLEIPLRASYTLIDNPKNSVNFNAGLSSYLMLKEDYTYKYTIASGHADRLVEVTNANQHYLSVLDLSATYNIKLKNKKFALGFEPYVKIPLSGIGEGKVPLKSSGVSLKLNYDFNKKK